MLAWLALESLVSLQLSLVALAVGLLMAWLAPQLRETQGAARWAQIVLLLALWVGLLFASLFGQPLGLPETWVINLNSMYITLFLPFAVALGLAGGAIWGWLRSQHWLAQVGGYTLVGGLLMTLLLFGVHQQTTIVNPATVLAEPPDEPALQWIVEKTPSQSVFAVSAWNWLGNTWAAQDGGAWIVPLTQRAATTPPADYTYSRDLIASVSAFNSSAEKITDWSTDDAINFLREFDVTHVYVGARGGYIKPDQLNSHPDASLLYAEDGVFIFAIRQR